MMNIKGFMLLVNVVLVKMVSVMVYVFINVIVINGIMFFYFVFINFIFCVCSLLIYIDNVCMRIGKRYI